MLSRTNIFTAGFLLAASTAQATEISGGLSVKDIKKAGKIVGFGSVHRAWTAAALPGQDLGLDLGVESTFIMRRDLNSLGNGQGVAPRLIPVPRLWAAWDLPAEIQVSGSYAPGGLFDGITAIGLAGQWTFIRDQSIRSTFSALMSYTYVNAFEDLKNHLIDIVAQGSRDLDFWQPYIGIGILVNNTTALSGREGGGVESGPYTQAVPHIYIGANLDLTGKLSFQLDLTGSKISLALLIARRF